MLLPLLVADFVMEAFKKGFMVRGGMVKGQMMHKIDGPVFGPALVKAYLLENSAANYARVLVHKDVFEFLKQNDKDGWVDKWVECGSDGFKEISISSFLNAVPSDEIRAVEAAKRIGCLKRMISALDAEDKSYSKVLEKYQPILKRLMDKHQTLKEICESNGHYWGEDLLTNCDFH